MLEKLIDQKIQNRNYSKLEIARVIYIELANILSFSTDYLNNYRYDVFQKVDYRTFNSNQVICKLWAQLYDQLLKKYDIESQIIDKGHSWVRFKIEGVIWLADATYGTYTDLARIKNGDNTERFGLEITFKSPSIDINNTQPILEQIDRKIGYYDKKKKINSLKRRLISIKNGEIDIEKETGVRCFSIPERVTLKMEYLFALLGNMNNGYYEAKDYVREMEQYLLTEEEMQLLKGTELIRINKRNTVDKLQIISIKLSDEKYCYYVLSPNLRICQILDQDIYKLAILGYGIGERNIPGITFPKKFVVSKKSKTGNFITKAKLFRESPYLEKYDTIQASHLNIY